jgi:fluoroacetyl-CoA thioesterase
MKNIFVIGDKKEYKMIVLKTDLASFHGNVVHPVMATFSLARDMEWTTRLFVLQMREDDEEGVGTFVHVDHHAPAFEGDELNFIGYIDELNGHTLICHVDVYCGDRLIANGKTGQKILKREKISKLFLKP